MKTEPEHDYQCDTREVGPGLGPSTKPCNCNVSRVESLELEAAALRQENAVLRALSMDTVAKRARSSVGLRVQGVCSDGHPLALYVDEMCPVCRLIKVKLDLARQATALREERDILRELALCIHQAIHGDRAVAKPILCDITRDVIALVGRVADLESEDEFCCPKCGSFDVSELPFKDDFSSMKCGACDYHGQPGEDFPSRVEVVAELRQERDRFKVRCVELETARRESNDYGGHAVEEAASLRQERDGLRCDLEEARIELDGFALLGIVGLSADNAKLRASLPDDAIQKALEADTADRMQRGSAAFREAMDGPAPAAGEEG